MNLGQVLAHLTGGDAFGGGLGGDLRGIGHSMMDYYRRGNGITAPASTVAQPKDIANGVGNGLLGNGLHGAGGSLIANGVHTPPSMPGYMPGRYYSGQTPPQSIGDIVKFFAGHGPNAPFGGFGQ